MTSHLKESRIRKFLFPPVIHSRVSFYCSRRNGGNDSNSRGERGVRVGRGETHGTVSTHSLDETDSLEEESEVTCAFTFNTHDHLSLVVSLESTPLDCAKYCDTVYKPLLGLLV